MITPEEWELIAIEAGTTVEDLHARVAKIDEPVPGRERIVHEYDHDGDPITMGQWCVLYDSRFYRFIRETILPSSIWISTIWQGIDYHLDGSIPMIFETGVFWRGEQTESLPPPLAIAPAISKAAALADHDRLVRQLARGFVVPLPNQ